MKTPRIFVRLALGLGLGLSLTLGSCNDNDISSNDGNKDDSTEQTDLEWEKQISLQRLLGALADVDSLPDNWNSSSYHVDAPTIGQPENEATPYSVRLVATSGVEEAYSEYCNFVGKSNAGTPTAETWQMEGIGSVSFTPNNEAALYATIKVNIKQLPSLQEIRFVPASALGNNDGDNESYYYSFGDVIQDKNGKFWVCVRPANKALGLGQSHWCTFQLEDSNFKQVENNLTLSTALAKNQSKSETRVRNFFNLLRIINDPTQYENMSSFGDFSSDKFFTLEDVEKLHDLWDKEKVWNKIIPNKYQKDKDVNTFIRGCVSTNTKFHVLHYGYTSKGFFSSKTYKVYDLLMTPPEGGQGFFTTTPLITNIRWNGTREVDISKMVSSEGVLHQYEFFGYGNNVTYSYLYVVKYCTGAQLQGRIYYNLDDANPKESFTKSASGKGITDIFISKPKE